MKKNEEKKANDSRVSLEIKKEYLRDHLREVKNIAEKWLRELKAPDPFAYQNGTWGWQSAYRPATKRDTDSHHIMRRHLRSRALWAHHAIWENELDKVNQLVSEVRKQALLVYKEKLDAGKWLYIDDYLPTAIWSAFEEARGIKSERVYRVGVDEVGTLYGAYKIESSSSKGQLAEVQKDHRDFIQFITLMKPIVTLAVLWTEIAETQGKMQAIVNKILKSNDILYPCRFCRHLWK